MIDRYTRVILTIIAACLAWNIFAGADGKHIAVAQSSAVHVWVDGWGSYSADHPIAVTMR
jgi:hypothetical protein